MSIANPQRDPFTAVPVVTDNVETFERDDERVQLARRIPPKTRVGRFLARRLGFERYARVNLDERGTAFWRAIDGARSLYDIEAHLRSQFDFAPRDCREATVEFTKMLMLRGLIGLRLDDESSLTPNPNPHAD